MSTVTKNQSTLFNSNEKQVDIVIYVSLKKTKTKRGKNNNSNKKKEYPSKYFLIKILFHSQKKIRGSISTIDRSFSSLIHY